MEVSELLPQIPEILRAWTPAPYMFRTLTDSTPTYSNLEDCDCLNDLPDVKQWICEEIAGIHNFMVLDNEKFAIGRIRIVSERYNIPESRIYQWYILL